MANKSVAANVFIELTYKLDPYPVCRGPHFLSSSLALPLSLALIVYFYALVSFSLSLALLLFKSRLLSAAVGKLCVKPLIKLQRLGHVSSTCLRLKSAAPCRCRRQRHK